MRLYCHLLGLGLSQCLTKIRRLRPQNYSTTLQCNKVKGCDPVLVQKIFLVVKFPIDGFRDNVFSPEKLESFIVGCEESKDTCKSCGLVFKTPTGVTEHKCSFLHQNDIVEPMEFTKQVSSDADKIVQALVSHVADAGRLCGQAKLPTPPRPALTCADYVNKELPGGEIRSVTGDGGCMPRCVSLLTWGTEEHWKLIAMALNKKTIELFDSMKDYLIFPLKRKVGGSQEEMVFKDKDEYIKFLMCEESLVMWREGPDLNVLAHLLRVRVRVDVLISKDNKLDGGCPMVYGEQYEDRARMVLMFSTEENHYLAVKSWQKNEGREALARLGHLRVGVKSSAGSASRIHEKTVAQLLLSYDLVRVLLETMPSVMNQNANLTNGDSETVPHCAAQYGHLMCVKQLLDSGTEPNIKNIRKETALDQYGRQATVNLLLETHSEIVGKDTAYGIWGDALHSHTSALLSKQEWSL